MSLPNPSMSFTPFDPLTASEMNDIVENVEALSDGSGLATGTGSVGIANSKLKTGAGEPGGAWDTWTPTWAALTKGNGVETAKYKRVGNTVFFRYKLVFGTTTSITGSDCSLTPPVAFNTGYNRPTIGFGSSLYFDTSAPNYFPGFCGVSVGSSQVNIQPFLYNTAGTYANAFGYNTTNPVAFGTGDEIHMEGFYEVA